MSAATVLADLTGTAATGDPDRRIPVSLALHRSSTTDLHGEQVAS
ncbi:hypothetical protein [Streptomyces sp. UC4497]